MARKIQPVRERRRVAAQASGSRAKTRMATAANRAAEKKYCAVAARD